LKFPLFLSKIINVESKNKLFWNVINTFAIAAILLVIAYFHFLNIGTEFIIPLFFTVITLIFQYFYHANLKNYGILCFLWGYTCVFFTGKLFGILLFLVGLAFFAKKGFFEKHGYIKISCLLFFMLIDIIFLCRINIILMLNTFLEFLTLIFFLVTTLLLYEDKLHIFYNIKKEYFHLPETVLSAREKHIAELLSQGKKYSQIAEELSLSESTIKRTCQKIYEKFQVKTKQEFIDRYLELE